MEVDTQALDEAVRRQNPLTEKLRPHVAAIQQAAARGDHAAQQIIDLYRMHCSCPADPGAYAFCNVAFGQWFKEQP